jgi:predicted transcriptional regulator
MRTIAVSARISERLDRDLRTLAIATGRSKSWLVAKALRSYVETKRQFILEAERQCIEAVEQGIQAADEGRLVDHEAVVAKLKRRYATR